jgi:flagellum-specific ATP synthase
VLTRELAHRNHYPAIDVLQSVSRLVTEITSPELREAAGELRETLAQLRAKEDLISIGAYAGGTDPRVDYAIAKRAEIDGFLRQRSDEGQTAELSDAQLIALMSDRPVPAAQALVAV